MKMKENPYSVLGVSPEATEEDIKKAYRRLVKQYHPDLHPGDEAAARKMSEVNEAYELIKSGNASKYTHESGSGMQGSYERDGETFYYSYMDPDDILEAIFGSLGSFARYGHTGGGFKAAPDDYDLFELFEKYLAKGSLYGAAAVLNAISEKDGKWHYCAARLCIENGSIYEAQRHAEWAVTLEPGNSRYKELYDEIEEMCERSFRRAKRSRILMSIVCVIFSALFVFQMLRPLLEARGV